MGCKACVGARGGGVGAAFALLLATGCDMDLASSEGRRELIDPAPDYVVTGTVVPSGTLVLGQPFVVQTTIENVGDAGAYTTSTTRYFLSVDDVVGGDFKLAPGATVPPVAAGASDTRDVALTIRAEVADGAYYLIACADRDNTVPESNNTNNCAAEPVTVVGANLATEVVTDPPPSLVVGGSAVVGDITRNRGAAPSTPSAVVYYLSPTPTRGPGAVRVATRRLVPALAAGAASSGTATIRVPAAPAGTYYLVACADGASAVAETDEDDNCVASTGTTGIGPADMVVAAISDPPAGGLVGDAFSVTDTTANQGHLAAGPSTTRFFLSLDAAAGDDDLPIGERQVGALLAGQSSSAATDVLIPLDAPAGDYFVLACADRGGAVPESSETNNCTASAAPIEVRQLDTSCGGDTGGIVVEGVATSEGFTQIRQGSTAELVITGTGLEVITTARLDELDATLLSVSATEVRAEVAVPHATAPGARALTVRAGDLDCSVEGAIAVTPFVVAPAAPPGGFGTYQSPVDLCDPILGESADGDTVELLAGQHVCPAATLEGVTVTGAGQDQTEVVGRLVLLGSAARPFELRDLTVTGPQPAIDVRLAGALDILPHGTIANVAAGEGGIQLFTETFAATAAIEGYTYAGAGTAVTVADGTRATMASSTISGCQTAIRVGTFDPNRGHITWFDVTDTDIIGCSTGVLAENGFATLKRVTIVDADVGGEARRLPPPNDQVGFGYILPEDSVLTDVTVGFRIVYGAVDATRTSILDDEATPRANEVGVELAFGRFEMWDGTIAGHSRVGIEMAPVATPGAPFGPDVRLHDSVVEGGERGIEAHGDATSSVVWLQSSIVRDQTVAAVSYGLNPSEFFIVENSQLSVASGYALEDLRPAPSPFTPLYMVGTSLNGNSYEGMLIEGPVDNPPDFRILSPDGTVQF